MERKETRALIERLRATPWPTVPPGLEQRLASIGAAAPAARVTRGRKYVAAALIAGGAMAACLAVVVTILQQRRPARDVASTQPSLIIVIDPHAATNRPQQETRPCDIFPPLPPPL